LGTPPTTDDLQRLRALQRVVQHAVRIPGGRQGLEAVHATRFAAFELPSDDGSALARQPVERLNVYRELIRGTLKSAIGNELPKTRHRLGRERFSRYYESFLDAEAPTSRILRDVAYEFAVWVHPQLVDDPEVADFVPDLMRFELFEFDVYTGQRVLDPELEVVEEITAERPVAFDGTVRITRFEHAVHRLRDVKDNDDVPIAEATGVLAYRDENNRYRQMDLTPLATTILAGMILEHKALASAVQDACAVHEVEITQGVIEGTSRVLGDLAERGAISGSWAGAVPSAKPSLYFEWLCRVAVT